MRPNEEANLYLESRKAMQAFAEANLPELCAELTEWQDTAVLRDGKMRQLAQLCTFVSHGKLTQAERLVEVLAIRRLARDQQTAPVDLEQFREAVECWLDAALPANDVEAERKAKAQRLLSVIDKAAMLAAQGEA